MKDKAVMSPEFLYDKSGNAFRTTLRWAEYSQDHRIPPEHQILAVDDAGNVWVSSDTFEARF